MKKLRLLLLVTLSAALLLLYGCGKDEDQEVSGNNADPIESNLPEEPDSSAGTDMEIPEDDSKDTYQDTELPPEAGMVRSDVTNEWISEELNDLRPLAVMLPTDPEAQPQYGIGNASVLYEIMEEGNMSRQMAIIEDWQSFDKIGNIRSCRDYYLYAACEWDPILLHFGGVYYMKDRLAKGDIDNITGVKEAGDGTPAPGNGQFFRSSDKERPHNAYLSAEGILKAMSSLGYEENHRDKYYQPEHFNFAAFGKTNDLSSYSDAIDSTIVDMSPCFPNSKSLLEYNPEDGLYYKSLHGAAQIDAITGDQLTFTNIIVQYTDWNYQADNTYLHFDMCDSGNGGWFITQGKAIPITWSKKDDYSPTRYFDKNGKEVTLNTGKTYIAVVQDGKKPNLE